MTEQQRMTFFTEGFTKAQIDEIDLGMSRGLPIQIYASKDFMPQQMYQLRLGLEAGLEMAPYADPEYDWFQLEEIRIGLEEELDVSLYDRLDIPSRKMHQMRRGLEEKLDLTQYLIYDDGIMKQIRHALMADIDIISYVEKGYDAGQLEAMLEAAKEGLDIFQYVDIQFRGIAIEEIAEGLRNGIDVEMYAKPCYSWAQMEEIRLGLEAMVDISYYASPLYDRYQMYEIRTGLEDGLDVSEYTSFMYPACDMARIKEQIKYGSQYDDFDDEDKEDGENPQEGENRKEFVEVKISPDDMTAFVTVSNDAIGTITRKDILRALRLQRITQNIDPRMIDDILQGKHLGEMVKIAVGKPPVNGTDGYFEYFFDPAPERKPVELPDGSVDFQNMDLCEEVREGQKLAFYHKAGNGEQGKSVTGRILPTKKGKDLLPLRGKGFTLLEDKRTYICNQSGKVELSSGKMEITSVVMLPEVNQATGNVRFEGNVSIAGDVGSGAVIEAGGDVIIDGFVENAFIYAKGDVILKKGVNGGNIEAEGSVCGKFFESVNVRAGRSIQVNYCLHSNLFCEDTINVCGTKGLILGGSVFATKNIEAGNIGNSMGVKTVVKLGVSDKMREEREDIEKQLADTESKLKVLYKGKSDIEEKCTAEARNAMEMYIKIENAIYTLSLEKQQLELERLAIMKTISETKDSMMIVRNTLYDNVVIEINGSRTVSLLSHGVTVKAINNQVGIYKNS